MNLLVLIFLLFSFLSGKLQIENSETCDVGSSGDPNGYIAYVPWHGRFGNEIHYFLGFLSFANRLNRTLILPNFKNRKKRFLFTELLDPEPLRKYHRVVTQDKFKALKMDPKWFKRFCKAVDKKIGNNNCQLEGRMASKPYWEQLLGSHLTSVQWFEYHGHFFSENLHNNWVEAHPPSTNPLVAFGSEIVPYPMNPLNHCLQQYLRFSKSILKDANMFIDTKLVRPYLAIQIRRGRDWMKICDFPTGNNLKKKRGHFMDSIDCQERNNFICLTNKEYRCKYRKAFKEKIQGSELYVALTCASLNLCMAYSYNSDKKYGYLCKSLNKVSDDKSIGFKFCEKPPRENIPVDMCLPNMEAVKKDITKLIQQYDISTVFVATDNKVEQLQQDLENFFAAQQMNIVVTFVPYDVSYRPQVDLAVLEKADVFIGSCTSSYTSYVVRSRTINLLPTYFWGTNLGPTPKIYTSFEHCK